MIKNTDSLQIVYEGWNGYQQSIVNAVKSLTQEQLVWRPVEKFLLTFRTFVLN